jgi:multidrug efflux pump subunit AcrA (membrane-fusion protein)
MTDEELREILAKLAQAQIKTEEQLAKTDAQLAKTDAQLAKTDAQLAKTDAQLAKTDAQLAKTDAKLDRLAEMYGGVGNNQGRVAEEFFFNSLKHKPELNGIQFDFIDKNVTRSKAGIEEEYDLLLVNGKDIYIVEVKYSLHPRDIERMIGRKFANFKKLFPEYQNYQIHLALASFAVQDEVKDMALQQGITVLQRHGDVFETHPA